MSNSTSKLTIELFKCNGNVNKCGCKNKANLSANSCYVTESLETIISELIRKRGFEDFVEINSVETKSDIKLNCFVIIANKVINNFHFDEIINTINKELDKIIYSSLQYAKKDYHYQFINNI